MLHGKILVVILYLFLMINYFFYEVDQIHIYSFFVSTTYFLYSYIRYKKHIVYLFKPSILFIIYYTINTFFGYFAFKNNLIYKQNMVLLFDDSMQINYYVIYVITVITALIVLQNKNYTFNINLDVELIKRLAFRKLIFVFTFIVLVTEIIKYNIESQVGIFLIPRYLLIILISIKLAIRRGRLRFILFAAFSVLLLALTQLDAKREVLTMLIALYLIFTIFKQIQFTKQIRNSLIILSLSIVLVLSLSIARGFGNYEPTNILNSFKYVQSYVNEDNLPLLLHNSETTTLFTHGSNALNAEVYGYDNDYSMTNRFLLVLIPSRIVSFKSKSIISAYTEFFSPSLREEGKSLVSGNITEFIWTFGLLFGGIITVLFYQLYDYVLIKVEKFKDVTMFLFISLFHLFFMRGSGIDLYVQYVLVYYIFYRMIVWFSRIKSLRT